MADESELERLVIRLVGDISGYIKPLKEAEKTTGEAARAISKHVEGVSSRISSLGGGLRLFGERAAEAFASMSIGSHLKEAFGEWTVAEDNAFRLEAALKANGHEVELLMGQYKEFASEIQRVTTVGDDNVVAMLAMAEAYGLTGDKAKQAVQGAIALGAATGRSAESMVSIVAAVERGNVQLLRRLPGLRGIKDEAELVAKAEKMMTVGMEIARAEAQTSSGQLAQLKNEYGDFLEEIGQVVAQGVKPFVDGLRETVRWLQALSPQTKEAIVIVAALGSALLGIMPLLSFGQFFLQSVLNPIIIGTALIGTAIATLIANLGGFAAAWEMAKGKAEAFFGWIRPTIDAVSGAFKLLWEGVKEAAGPVWEWLRTVAAATFVRVQELIRGAAAAISDFAVANRSAIATVMAATSAVVAAYTAYRLFVITLGITNSLLAALKIQQAATLVLWTAWKVVVLAASGVMAVYNAMLAVFNGTLLASAGSIGIVAAAKVAWKAIVWAVNAALTVMNALLAPAVLLAVVATVTLIGGAFAIVGASIVAAYQAGVTLFDTLLAISSTRGPLSTVAPVFREWLGILGDVVETAKTDVPGSWKLLKAGAELALEQVRALWPPLWDFIKAGTLALWDVLFAQFKAKFLILVQEMEKAIAEHSGGLLEHGVSLDEMMNIEVAKGAAKAAQDALNDIRFQVPDMNNDAIRKARENVEGIMNENDVRFWVKQWEEFGKAGEEAGKGIVDGVLKLNSGLDDTAKKMKEIANLQATLFGSAEDFSRRAAYEFQLRGMFDSKAAPVAAPVGAQGAPFAPQAQPFPAAEAKDKEVLKGILAVLRRIDERDAKTAQRPGLEIRVGLGQG